MPVSNPIPTVTIDYSLGTSVRLVLSSGPAPNINIINVPQSLTVPAAMTILFENHTPGPVYGPNWVVSITLSTPTFVIPAGGAVVFQLFSANGGGNWYGDVVTFTAPPVSVTSLGDLTDVVLTTPTIDQVLTYDGTNWINAPISTGGSSAITWDVANFNLFGPTIVPPGNGNNVAYGRNALLNLDSGFENTAIGHNTLRFNTSGNRNTAIGYESLMNNTTGGSNVGIGWQALNLNTDGYYNIAIGEHTLYSNTTGTDNVAVGSYSLASSITGSYNVALGAGSGVNATGQNNIMIGYESGTDAVANITTQNNYIVLGNNRTTNANIKVAWTVTSDARDKTEIAPISVGLSFINQLLPKQFKLMDRITQQPTTGVRYGFIAQDVLSAEGDDPVIVDVSDINNLKLRESLIVPALVKAVQELSAEITLLKLQLQNLTYR